MERSAEVLHAWRAWVADVPDETMSVGRILRIPPAPEIPETLRGRAFAPVEAVHLGSEAVGAELLEPLRRLGPVIDTVGSAKPVDLAGLHMDPPDPLPYDGVHQLLEYLPGKAIDEIVRLVGRIRTPRWRASSFATSVAHCRGRMTANSNRAFGS